MTRYSFQTDQDDNDTKYRQRSCRLVTSDDCSIYTLTRTSSNEDRKKRYIIETQHLPLLSTQRGEQQYYSENEDAPRLPTTIRTELPDEIQYSLEIDDPIELICFDGEHRRANNNKKDNNDVQQQQQQLPCLLLYTRKSAFSIHISYQNETDIDAVLGTVLSYDEPLDRYLHGSMEKSIIRIRKAPQCANGFAMLSPLTCFAALIENNDTGEYSLVLHHGIGGTLTSPLNVALEETVEEERITDFCFAQSLGDLSLFSSMSVLLLKGSGDVFSASPIIFDGSIVSKSILDDSHGYLQDRMNSYQDQNSAGWRHAKAASQFLVDVFGHSENRGQFCTAQVLHQADRSAAMWPVKLQGPILFHSEMNPGLLSVSIENFGGTESSVGIAIAQVAGKIDFACLSPTSFIPRFKFESQNDSYELDDALFGHASLVERVDLCPEALDNVVELSSICMIRDPIVNNLLHYSSSSTVYTISTNVMRIVNHQLQGLPVDPIRTTAWVCLNSADTIKGITVPSDSLHGHTLYVGLSNNELSTVDVSESTYLHEFGAIFHRPVQNDTLLALENGLASDSPQALSDIKPIVEKIQSGLSNMGRFVGSDTSYADITPDTLAVALQTKKRCDNDIVVPLLELKRILDKYRLTISALLVEQETQLQAAKDNIKTLQGKMSATSERLKIACTNAVTLSERSSAAFQTSQKLLPIITQAEYDFFQMIKRMNIKCLQMESYVQKLNDLVLSRCETLNQSSIADSVKHFDNDNMEQATSLLRYEDKMLKAMQLRLAKAEKVVHSAAKEVGTTKQLINIDNVVPSVE